jgi:predicted nucleic acid-binding Zn ribbon protein
VPRRTRFDEDDPPDDWADDYGAAEEGYDPEADWSPGDEFLPGEAAELPCPHCGAAITEDHQRCPNCEMFLTKEGDPKTTGNSSGLTWIVVIAVVLVLIVALEAVR